MKMTEKPIADQHHQTFEGIRQFDPEGNEYWKARQLARVLEYSEFRHFLPVIERASEACRNSGHPELDHFEDVLDMVDIGSGAKRQVADIHLSRYACWRDDEAIWAAPCPRPCPSLRQASQQVEKGKKKLEKKK